MLSHIPLCDLSLFGGKSSLLISYNSLYHTSRESQPIFCRESLLFLCYLIVAVFLFISSIPFLPAVHPAGEQQKVPPSPVWRHIFSLHKRWRKIADKFYWSILRYFYSDICEEKRGCHPTSGKKTVSFAFKALLLENSLRRNFSKSPAGVLPSSCTTMRSSRSSMQIFPSS